jgi:hypothetical protein
MLCLNQRIQVEVIYNSTELDFWDFDKIRDFWAYLWGLVWLLERDSFGQMSIKG